MTPDNWNRRVWRLAGPIILSNISVPLLGVVDTAVVGHLPGPQYIGGVAIGALIFSFVYWGFGFLRMGTGGFVAQALGAGDADEVRASLARALILAGVLGMGVVALQGPIAWVSLALIAPSETVLPLAESYVSIRIWGAPAALANYAILGFFIGIQNTRAALVVQVAMNGANIVLDLVFVLGFGMGVEGVAIATLISEVGAAGLGLWLVARNLGPVGGHWQWDRIMDAAKLRRLFAVNRDIFIRTLCLIGAFALFTSVGARMGDVVLAANAVLFNFQTLMAYALDGFAHAAETLAGSAFGAGDRRQFRAVVRATSLWALIFSGAFTLFYLAFGTAMVDLMTTVAEVRATAYAYLPWVIVLPMISVWSFQLDGIYIGTTRSAGMRNAMVLSVALYIAAVFILTPLMGNHGLWLALTVLMVARGVTMGLGYPRIERSVGA